MKRFFFFLTMCLYLSAGYAAAYSPTDFVDVFTNPKVMPYCSQSPSVNGVAGVTGPCVGGLYYYNETVTGFKDQNNPNDPKRLCQKDTVCSPEPQVMYPVGTYSSVNPSDGKVPSLFRIYIPPGTTAINMNLYVPQARVAAVVRMGAPPANPNKPISEYGNIQTVGLQMNDVMNGGDFWTRNGDGNIQIFYGGAIDQTVLQNKGFSDRWLYVQIVNYDAAWLETLTFNMTIGDMAAYKNWYNSVNWDCYDNPGDAAKCSGIPSVPSYTVNFTAGAGGTVSTTSPQTVAQSGSTASVTATPNSNYTFVNWTGQNGFTSTNNPITISNVTENMTITANFQTVAAAQSTILDILCLETQGSYYKTSLKAYTPSDLEKKEQNFSDSQGFSFWEMTDWIKADTTTQCGTWNDNTLNFTFPGQGSFEFHRDAGSDDFFGFYWKQTP